MHLWRLLVLMIMIMWCWPMLANDANVIVYQNFSKFHRFFDATEKTIETKRNPRLLALNLKNAEPGASTTHQLQTMWMKISVLFSFIHVCNCQNWGSQSNSQNWHQNLVCLECRTNHSRGTLIEIDFSSFLAVCFSWLLTVSLLKNSFHSWPRYFGLLAFFPTRNNSFWKTISVSFLFCNPTKMWIDKRKTAK